MVRYLAAPIALALAAAAPPGVAAPDWRSETATLTSSEGVRINVRQQDNKGCETSFWPDENAPVLYIYHGIDGLDAVSLNSPEMLADGDRQTLTLEFQDPGKLASFVLPFNAAAVSGGRTMLQYVERGDLMAVLPGHTGVWISNGIEGRAPVRFPISQHQSERAAELMRECLAWVERTGTNATP